MIVKYPDPRLAETCSTVNFDESLKETLNSMRTQMFKSHGAGLAGPQVGVMKRLFVAFVEGAVQSFVNPEVVKVSEETISHKEGCLSLPKFLVNVPRSTEITLKWQDEDGTACERAFEGWDARVLLHELDHLNGVTLWEYASPAKKRKYRKKNRTSFR